MVNDLDRLFKALHRNFGKEYPDPRVTAIAKRAVRDEAVLDRVIADLGSNQEKVYGASCTVLAEIGPPAARAVSKLLRLVSRADDPSHVAYALGALGDSKKKVLSALLRLLDDKRNWVRSSAINALGSLNPPAGKVVPGLTRFLDRWQPPWENHKVEFDPDVDDFGDAVAVIGSYGENAASALSVLERLAAQDVDDQDDGVRQTRFLLQATIARIRGEPPPSFW